MVSITSSIVIHRKLPDVYGFITDPANTPVWHSDILEDKGEKGMPVGSGGALRMQTLGMHSLSHYEVLENDGKSYTHSRSTRGPIKFETKMILTPAKGGCRLTVGTTVDTGPLFRLAESALESIVGSHVESDLMTLKVLLEAGA